MTSDIEIRDYAGGSFSVGNRSADAPLGVLSGVAVPYDSPSQDLGGFFEYMAPGVFTESLKSRNQLALLEHTDFLPLGRVGRNLELKDTPTGLTFRLRPLDTQAGRDAVSLVRNGIITQCSFSFRVDRDGDEVVPPSTRDGTWKRIVRSATLFEISLVGRPAYPASHVSASARAWRLVNNLDTLGRPIADVILERRLTEFYEIRDRARQSGRDVDWERYCKALNDIHGRGVPYLTMAAN